MTTTSAVSQPSGMHSTTSRMESPGPITGVNLRGSGKDAISLCTGSPVSLGSQPRPSTVTRYAWPSPALANRPTSTARASSATAVRTCTAQSGSGRSRCRNQKPIKVESAVAMVTDVPMAVQNSAQSTRDTVSGRESGWFGQPEEAVTR